MTLRRFLRSSWLPMIGALLGIVVVVWDYGVPVLALGKFAVYLALAVAVPGVFAWRLLLAHLHTNDSHDPTWFEDLSLGTIFGFGIQLPLYLVGVWIDVPLLFLILPVIAIVLSAATRFGRGAWMRPTSRVDVRLSWAMAVIIVYAVAWLGRYIFPIRSLALPLDMTPSVDETFHQALISELLHRFPPQIPFLLGTRLDYHWFVHAQMAADHWATDVSTQLMLRALMPAAVMALTVLGLGAVALRLTGRPLAAAIASALLVVGGFSLMGPHYGAGMFTEAFMSWRFVSSPSQAYGFMMALPAIMLILEVLRPDRKPSRLTWITLTLALFALSGSKATFMPIFLCGAVALWVFHLAVKRMFDRTAAALVGLLLVVTIFAQVVLFGGSSGAMAFDPFLTVKDALEKNLIAVSDTSVAVTSLTMLIGWLLYGVGAYGLRRHKLWRDPRSVWMLACIPAGITVAFVFFRSGLSQYWFQRSVAELVVLASAWGLVQVLPNPLTKRHALRLGGVAASAGLAAYVISRFFEAGKAAEVIENATLPEIAATALAPFVVVAIYLLARLIIQRVGGVAWPGPVVLLVVLLGLATTHVYSFAYDTVTRRAVPIDPPEYQFAPGGVVAAEWIAHHSDRYDIVATNVHCRLPKASECDNRNFWIAAYSERRIVVEGWGYTAETNGAFTDEDRNGHIAMPDPERLEINDAAFTNPSPETVGRLVDAYDVKYLFVGKPYPVDIPGLNSLHGILLKKFSNDNYVVFKVVDR